MKNPRSGDDFTHLANTIQRAMAKRSVGILEDALGVVHPAEGTTSIVSGPREETWSSSEVVERDLDEVIPQNQRRQHAARGSIAAEREIQQSIAYGVVRGIYVGWSIKVFDGENGWRYWRPTRRWADYFGRHAVRYEVRMRQRRWEYDHPQMRTARDLWIVPPTDLESWIEAYKQAEGKQ